MPVLRLEEAAGQLSTTQYYDEWSLVIESTGRRSQRKTAAQMRTYYLVSLHNEEFDR